MAQREYLVKSSGLLQAVSSLKAMFGWNVSNIFSSADLCQLPPQSAADRERQAEVQGTLLEAHTNQRNDESSDPQWHTIKNESDKRSDESASDQHADELKSSHHARRRQSK